MKKKTISLLVATAMFASFIPVSFAEREMNSTDESKAVFDSIQITDGNLFTEMEDVESALEETEEFTDNSDTELEEQIDEVSETSDEEIDLFDENSIELYSTGTYYPEYGFYFDASSGTITDTDESISGYLEIPETIDNKSVLKIGRYAFQNCTSLIEVNIPKAVTNIERGAFQGCINLSKVTLNYNNAREFKLEISYDVFRDCAKLSELILPETVTYLGDHFIAGTSISSIVIPKSIASVGEDYGGPLAGCSTLTQVTLENGITIVPDNLFNFVNSNSYIENIIIPESVTRIGQYAFRGCNSITEINIPKAVAKIEKGAFQWCTNLSKVTLNYNNTREFKLEISYDVFRDCAKLSELILPETVTYLGDHFIAGTSISSIVIPKSITSVGEDYGGPLAGCSTLTQVTIEDGIVSVPDNLFNFVNSNSYIENVVIPESVTKIGRYAFRECDSITEVNIPKAVTNIERGAFQGCINLSKVTLNYNNAREFKLEISYDVFRDCEKLTELILPETVTYLGDHFIAGTSISSIVIPKSIVSVGEDYGGPLAGCISLTYVTLEDGITSVPNNLFNFVNSNSYIENIIIPESVTRIGQYAFRGCNSITEINIPKAVAKIEKGAFQWCTNLSKVTLNYNNTREFKLEISYDVFRDCAKLSELILPETVTYLGDHFIAGTAISSIIVPKSILGTGADYGGPFAGAVYLDDIIFEDGTTEIFNYECESNSDMSYISRIEIPSTVTKIGKGAFKNCTKLKSLNIPDSVQTINNEAFYNCPQLTVSISEAAPAIADLIDDDVRFSLTREITNYNHFIYSSTDYYSKTNEMTGYVPFEVKYAVKDNVNITDKKLTIRIPTNSELVQNTLRINGIISTDFAEDDNLLTIPVSDDSAVITFCVKPTEYTTLLSYAKMNFKENGENKTEMIGVVNCSIPDISIKADNITNSGNVTVEGIAPPSSNVDFYIGDELVGSTSSKKSGNYKTSITIPSPENYNKYTISAQTYKGKEDVRAEATVMYEDAAPTLKTLNMYYGDHNGIHKYELSNQTTKPTIVYNPAYGFKFAATFDNAENLDKVYIVSTRNNQKKYMTAEWDKASQSFIAEGRFEGTNSNYVPGEITVEYTKKRQTIPVSETINTEELIKHMDSAVKECTTTVTENTDVSYKATINVADKLTDLLGDEINMAVTTVDKEYSDVSIPSLMKDAENFYSYFIDEGSDKYVLNIDLTDPEKLNMIVHDISGNKTLNYALDFLDNSEPGNPSRALAISEVLSGISTVTGTIADMYDIETNDDDLRDKIYAAGMTPEKQAEALKKADELKRDRQLFLLLTTGITVATMGMAGPSAMIFGLLFGAVTTSSSFFWDMRMANILGGGTGYSCKWSIDPSGYVYEAVAGNRLEGVTATAYWISPDYIDENGKGDTSKSELWDASEYEQLNPLITDINGAYAWDVPEGLWQVKYEKDGYETQLSDWLPVPPPQTEVNIGLVSKTAPTVESAVLKSNSLTVTFDKYMKPDTVNNVSIGNHTYTMDYNKTETAADGTVYAKTYTFKLNQAVADGESVAVSISNAESYAGIKMTAYSKNVVCSNAAEKVEYGIRIENAVDDKSSKSISADFTNLTEKLQSFDAICAVYDENGALLGIKALPIVALEGNSKTNKVFNFDKEWNTYKVFAWDSLGGMQPIAE